MYIYTDICIYIYIYGAGALRDWCVFKQCAADTILKCFCTLCPDWLWPYINTKKISDEHLKLHCTSNCYLSTSVTSMLR